MFRSTALGAAMNFDANILEWHQQGPGVRSYVRSRRDRNGNPVLPYGFVPANINRHTMRPHEHKREIVRRLGLRG